MYLQLFSDKSLIIRDNQATFITTELSKAIMIPSKLKNIYVASHENFLAVKTSKNIYNSKKVKKSSEIYNKRRYGSKKFGDTVKPLTPKVFMHNENIAIKVKGKYITSEIELTKTFNSHCINTFKNDIVLVSLLLVNFEHISHLVLLFLFLTLSSQILAGLVFPLLETTFMFRKNSKFSLLQSEKLTSLLKI